VESVCFPLFVRGGEPLPPAVRTSETCGREGPTFFLRLLVSRHPDPTQDNPLFRDKPRQEFFFLACLSPVVFDEAAAPGLGGGGEVPAPVPAGLRGRNWLAGCGA